MAAIRASGLGARVTLLEKNPTLGRKLLLSGKGRCNLTNNCDQDLFLKRFSKNGQFLRDAFKKFFNRDLIDFFEKRGLGLRVERQMRVFPVSGRSSSVLNILQNELRKNKVEIINNAPVADISVAGGAVTGVAIRGGKILAADRVILATGGVSYSVTGSTGDGQKIAAGHGHTIVPFIPGLVPLVAAEKYVRDLEGITLKNIRISFISGKKQVTSPVGELLFTSSGISGPLVLTHSGIVAEWLAHKDKVYVEIDLKPGITYEQLDSRLLREFASNARKSIKNTLKDILPLRLIGTCLTVLKIDPGKICAQIKSQERRAITSLLKGLRLDIVRTANIEEAMVTRGGVTLKEINPRTMESRLIKGLYFSGEMIDVDADTGGFNLQAAFSTGYLAGESAAL